MLDRMVSEKKNNNNADHRHTPKQMRGIETRNSILESAMTLFAQRGYDQTTTHQIAAHAGISVGAVYRYFSDKEAIVKEIYQMEVSELRQRLLEGFNVVDIVTKDIRGLAREAMGTAFKVYAERPDLWRVLMEQSRKIPDLAEIRRDQEVDLYRTVQQILAATPKIRMPDIEVGAYLITLFFDSLIIDFVLYRRGKVDFSDERVIDVALDFITNYVWEE